MGGLPPVAVTEVTVTQYLFALPEVNIHPHLFCIVPTLGNNSTNSTSTPAEVLITIITEPEDGVLRADYRLIWRLYLPVISGNLLFVMGKSHIPSIQVLLFVARCVRNRQ